MTPSVRLTALVLHGGRDYPANSETPLSDLSKSLISAGFGSAEENSLAFRASFGYDNLKLILRLDPLGGLLHPRPNAETMRPVLPNARLIIASPK